MRLHYLLSIALYFSLLCAAVPICAYAQQSETDAEAQEQGAPVSESEVETPPPADAPITDVSETIAIPFGVMTSREFLLSGLLLLFGLLVIGVQYTLLRSHKDRSPDELTRSITVTLIIIGTLVLISSGFNNNQIAPAVGLFGTIAGYLLGRVQGRPNDGAGSQGQARQGDGKAGQDKGGGQ